MSIEGKETNRLHGPTLQTCSANVSAHADTTAIILHATRRHYITQSSPGTPLLHLTGHIDNT